ncbi:MAG: hypothetical protein JKY54_00825, partial [Flavobacteriales bacterium]|nr:hypothetical protein [Flavobacteriales bacterium]
MKYYRILMILCTTFLGYNCYTQNSESRVVTDVMELLLEVIKLDEGRPTVHARNLFHTSAAMYDAWSIYDDQASTYLIGKTVSGFKCDFDSTFTIPTQNIDSLREIAIVYAGFNIAKLKFQEYSSKGRTMDTLLFGFDSLGYNPRFWNTDYQNGTPESMGCYIAECYYEYALQDGAREEDGFETLYYSPMNAPFQPNHPGTGIKYINRWLPISIKEYVTKRGFEPDISEWARGLAPLNADIFLTPDWGFVVPFSLEQEDLKTFKRRNHNYPVYLDAGDPPYLNTNLPQADESSKEYMWNFQLVASWSSHQDPNDGVMIDISPSAIGEALPIPTTYAEYHDYFDFKDGGVKNRPFKKNPKTKSPYPSNIVKRGDYVRVIAEYWVDGIGTYTPPGHWVKILHQI